MISRKIFIYDGFRNKLTVLDIANTVGISSLTVSKWYKDGCDSLKKFVNRKKRYTESAHHNTVNAKLHKTVLGNLTVREISSISRTSVSTVHYRIANYGNMSYAIYFPVHGKAFNKLVREWEIKRLPPVKPMNTSVVQKTFNVQTTCMRLKVYKKCMHYFHCKKHRKEHGEHSRYYKVGGKCYIDCKNNGGIPVRGLFPMECIQNE